MALLTVATAVPAADLCTGADVNGDEVIDNEDRYQVESHLGAMHPEAVREDLDGDLKVTAADVVIVRSYINLAENGVCAACVGDFTKDPDFGGSDRDGDGTVDGLDLDAVVEAAALGLVDCRLDLNRDGAICLWDLVLFQAYRALGLPLSHAAARADFNGDGRLNDDDLAQLQMVIDAHPARRNTTCRFDLNRDGVINAQDRWALLSLWGRCSGPPGDDFAGTPSLCKTDG